MSTDISKSENIPSPKPPTPHPRRKTGLTNSHIHSPPPPSPPPPPPPPPQPKPPPLPPRSFFPRPPKSTSSSYSSDCSNLSASIPVLTKVIPIESDRMTQSLLQDQTDLYNFSQDSLLQYSQKIPNNMAHDTPHMTLVSPAAGIQNDERKQRVKKRDQKLRKMMFGNYATLQRQRSLVIKELMIGHDHEGCLMTSQPVQNELRKLLNKTIKGKSNKNRSRKSSSIEKLRRWMTKRKNNAAKLVNSSDSSTTDLCSCNDSVLMPNNEYDKSMKSDSYLTPISVPSLQHSPEPFRRGTSFRQFPSERNRTRHYKGVDCNGPNIVQRHNNIKQSNNQFSQRELASENGHSHRKSFRSRKSLSPEREIAAKMSLRKNLKERQSFNSQDNYQSFSRKHQNSLSTRKHPNEFHFTRWHSERQHPTFTQRKSRRRSSFSVSLSFSSFESDFQSLPHSQNGESERPESRLERVRRAWKEEDIYALNPFDSWRLRQHDLVLYEPSRTLQNRTHSTDDFETGRMSQLSNEHQQRQTFLNGHMPIRQRVQNFWKGKDVPSPRPTIQRPTVTQQRHDDILPLPTFPPTSSHLFPPPADIFFRPHPLHDSFFNSGVPAHPLDPTHPEASPLVLGWLQVPPEASQRLRNNTFRKAPWFQNLHFLHR